MSSNIEDKKTKIKVYTVAVIYTVVIGFSFLAIKVCVPYAEPLQILSYRYLFGLIGVIGWFVGRKVLGIYIEKPPGRHKMKLYLTAGFYIGFMTFQILSMYFATSIEGAIIFAMVPIFAKIIARIFLGETSTLLQNAFVGITVVALIVLIILNATDVSVSLPGIILLTISSISMAISNVLMRYVRGTFKPIEITTTIVIGGFFLFNGVSVIKSAATGGFGDYFEPLTHPQFLIAIAFLGIFCILLSAQFMAYMLANLEIVQSTIFGNASTAITIVAGALILGEPLQWYHLVCATLIIVGVVGLSIAPASAENTTKKL